MDKDAGDGDVRPANVREALTLRVAASLLAQRAVQQLSGYSDLSAEQLRRQLDAVGPLEEIPHRAWEQFAERVRLHPVPRADRRGLETVVPLWTADGSASRAVRVRLLTNSDGEVENFWICGFVDVLSDPEWHTIPADPIAPPEPLETLPSRGKNPVPEYWRPVLSEVVHRLVIEDYEGLQRDGIVRDVDDPERDLVKTWIERYHDPLVDLPENAWEWSDTYPAYDGPGTYGIVLRLWTAYQGLSDLSLEGNVVDGRGENIRVYVFSVHVM